MPVAVAALQHAAMHWLTPALFGIEMHLKSAPARTKPVLGLPGLSTAWVHPRLLSRASMAFDGEEAPTGAATTCSGERDG